MKKPATRDELAKRRRATSSTISVVPGLTPLEAAAVLPSTASAYRLAVSRFAEWCTITNRNWTAAENLDPVLVDFLNFLFLDGANMGEATQTVAGLKHFLPGMGATTVAKGWPRVHRALRGWGKLAPTSQRLPIPRAVAMAIAGVLALMGCPRMACFVALSFVCYLRPSEGIQLRGCSVVTPSAAMGSAYQCYGLILHDASEGLVGKTGVSDESVLLDLDVWLAPVLQAWAQRAG